MTCDGVLGVEKLLGFKMSGSDGQWEGVEPYFVYGQFSGRDLHFAVVDADRRTTAPLFPKSSGALNGLQLGRERSPRMSVNPHLNYSTQPPGPEWSELF